MKKICKECGELLDVSNFFKNKSYKDGYENKCKKCRKKNRKNHNYICSVCGKNFQSKETGAKYCSRICAGKARKTHVKTTCTYCGKSIEVIPSKFKKINYLYCNQNCRTKHLKELMKGENNPNYNRVKYTCDGCGKEIYIIPSLIKKQKHIFCSNDCYKTNIGKFISGKNNPNYNHKEYTCKWCGINFNRKPSSSKYLHKFCSRKCYEEYRKNNIGNIFRGGTVIKECPICGEKFKVYKSQLYTVHQYCSKKCANIGWSKYYSGKNSPLWNPNLNNDERIQARHYQEYHKWRNDVFKKDNYTCQCCSNSSGGNLNAHHIYNYSEYKELRLDINNGITLCDTCHKEFHVNYGYKHNNKEQLKQFLDIYKQVKII